jgi:hypothetical protein
MWVSVDSCKGDWPNITYRGVLENVPVFIGPEKLQYGSAVTFQMPHVQANPEEWLFSRREGPNFVAIEADTTPWLTIHYRTRKPAYPLTAEGIRQAGRDLYDSGSHACAYSSSVDFAAEVGCDLDVGELIHDGFAERAKEVGDTRFPDAESVWKATSSRASGAERGHDGPAGAITTGREDESPSPADAPKETEKKQ